MNDFLDDCFQNTTVPFLLLTISAIASIYLTIKKSVDPVMLFDKRDSFVQFHLLFLSALCGAQFLKVFPEIRVGDVRSEASELRNIEGLKMIYVLKTIYIFQYYYKFRDFILWIDNMESLFPWPTLVHFKKNHCVLN